MNTFGFEPEEATVKNKGIIVFAAVILFAAFFQSVFAEIQAGFTVGSEGVQNFYLGLSEYNNVPVTQITAIRNNGIPDEELPVVFFMAQKAGVSPEKIIAWRIRKHLSWMAIAGRLSLSPEVFYVPVEGPVNGGIYGRTYGYFDIRHKSRWNRIKLMDADIINFVNLRFMSEHYGYRPEEIIRLRESGKPFIAIHNDIRVERVKTYGRDFHQWRDHKNDNNDKNDHRQDKHWN